MTPAPQSYGFGTHVALGFDDAVQRVTDLLKDEGFGVLTTIDVQRTLREKLDVPFRRYTILGACNPRLAHRAFEVELEIGLLLPCNVVVYEEEGGTHVSFMDAVAAMGFVGHPALEPVAAEARERLARVSDRLAGAR